MRLSATMLESFRLWLDPEQEWMSEAQLLATIRGEFHPTREIDIGQAFGRVLEAPDRYRVDGGYHHPRLDVFLSDETMQPALDLIDRPHTVFEAKGVGRYGPHDVVVKADQLVGAHLIETKTTFSTFSFEKYADSCQWRFMADILQPTYVTYQVFVLKEDKNGSITLKSVEAFNLFPYDGLHRDCEALVVRFEGFARARDLVALLDRRQAEAA